MARGENRQEPSGGFGAEEFCAVPEGSRLPAT